MSSSNLGTLNPPPVELQIPVVIGIDIGGTKIRIGAVTEQGALYNLQVVAQESILFDETAMEQLHVFIADYIANGNKNWKVNAVVLAFPATLDKSRSMVTNAPNITGMNEKPVRDYLQNSLGVPVYLTKDVNALLHYDIMRFRIAIDSSSVITAFYVGTGLGNAIFMKGDFFAGESGAAGELGHVPIWGEEAQCSCGNIGCAECAAAGKCLNELLKTAFPNTPGHEIFTKHANDSHIIDFIGKLAAVIATEINILDPGTVVLGGGVLDMPDFPMHALEAKIASHSRKPLPTNRRVIHSTNPDDKNGVVGSAMYGWKTLSSEGK